MRIVIVGNGPAALSAVEAIRERDGECDITILSPEGVRAYTPCFLAKYVAGTIDEERLSLKCDDFHQKHGVELCCGQPVVSVKPEEKAVVLQDGSLVSYDRLLLAYGAAPMMPDIPGLSGEGVYVFRSLPDAEKIRAAAATAKRVVVLGSGFVAMEIAEALAETGVAVTVIARKERILRRIFDPEVAALVESHMAQHGVHFAKGHDLADVERSDDGLIRAAILGNGERLECDMIVVGVGMQADTTLVDGTAIAVGRGILTDAGTRTSAPDVYAAGDVAEMEIDGVRKVNLIHPNAVVSGRIAGYNMTGADESLPGHLSDMNVLTVFGRSFLSAGSFDGEVILRRRAGSDGLLMVFADGEGTITGVQLVGDVTRGGLYASLIQREVSVDAVPELLSGGFNYGVTAGLV